MEVDYLPTDECKESDVGALLALHELGDAAAADSPLPDVDESSQECSVRRDSAGRQLCEKCGRQLSKVKHHRAYGVGRACTPRCKPTAGVSTSCNEPASTPPRSHKRKQQPTGQPPSSPAAILPLPPPLPTSLLDRHSWDRQGFQFVRGNHARGAWHEMRAQFFEQDMRQSLQCSPLEQQRVRVVSNAESCARDLLSSLGVDHSSLRLSDIGCLRTDHNIGLQEIHADIQKFEYAPQCNIVIFYLVDTESTAVADVERDELDPVWSMNVIQAEARLASVAFPTSRVLAGDSLVMNGKTFHYGVGNPDEYQRFVGFLTFTPKSLPPFDSQEQFYPTGVRYG